MKALQEAAYKANMDLQASGLVLFTFGNVSAADRKEGLMAIKPSGVAYEKLTRMTWSCFQLRPAR